MRKKKLYVIGYDGDSQCVYGKNKWDVRKEEEKVEYCDPMSIYDAKRKLKDLKSAGNPKPTIYRLVPVDPEKEKV